jgi:hypothetical protein
MLPQMQKIHVRRLQKKHRFLMFLLKKIGNRVKGMGFKVMKVHAMIHLAYDILMFSVPMNLDTGSNESHHKRTKVAAKLTQKDIKTFKKQTSNRCNDFHVLDLAMEEIDGRPLWEYYNGFEHQTIVKKPSIQATGGMMIVMSRNQEYNDAEFKVIYSVHTSLLSLGKVQGRWRELASRQNGSLLKSVVRYSFHFILCSRTNLSTTSLAMVTL